MTITNNILDHELPQVAALWREWAQTMHRDVAFWPIDGDLDVHTEGHCERVLLLALKLGAMRQRSSSTLAALAAASIFHDTRRKDNYLDVGHGDRAADYYKAFCDEQGLQYQPATYAAIKFHDRDDQLGLSYIAAEGLDEDAAEVYRVFKDADALDRLRLGPWMLDTRYLRTPEAHQLVDYAQQLVEATMEPEAYQAMKDWTRPFAERMGWKGN